MSPLFRYLCILLLFPFWGYTQNISLLPGNLPQRINEQALWIEDSTATLHGNELLQHPQSFPFRKAKKNEEFFNRYNYPVYCWFTLHNKTPDNLFLLIDNSNIEEVGLWYTYKGTIQHVTANPQEKDSQLAFKSNKVILKLPSDGTVQKVLVKTRSSRKLIVPTYLANPGALHNFLSINNGLDLLLLGMVLMLLLYNLFMVAQTKSRSQLFYICYLVSLIVYAFFHVRGFRHFLPHHINQAIYQYSYTWNSLCYLFALLFAKAYFRKKPLPPWFQIAFNFLLLFPLAAFCCSLMAWDEPAYVLSIVLAFVTPVFMLSIGAMAYQKNNKSTLFFILGWTSVSLCTITNTLLLLEVIPPTMKYIPQLLLAGTCLEMLFLSSGLGYRFSKVQKEKLALQKQLLELLNNKKTELELQVTDRTQALAKALVQVEESDALKSRLLAIISHDLRMPFVSLNASLDLLTLNILTPEKAQQKLANVKSNIRHIAGTLENLLTWSKHQQQRIQTQPERIDLKELAENVCRLLETNISSKNLVLQLDIPEGTEVQADRFQLEAILRNLVSNGIKASNAYSVIGIRCVAEAGGSMFRIVVFDSGLGLQEDNLAAWLKRSNPLQDGATLLSGLGLQICREFLANHHSELCYGHNGEGSEFSFLLPAAHQEAE